jgi:hypothetical protein
MENVGHEWEAPELVQLSTADVADAGENTSRAEFTFMGGPVPIYAPLSPGS